MFSNINTKIIALIGAAMLVVAAVFCLRGNFSDEKTCSVTVGGKQNPCQCTQRLER